MRGRKPIPTSLHIFRGTYRATRHGKGRAAEPVAPGDLPVEPPEGLTESQAAIWCHVMATAPQGILKAIDLHVLLGFVTAADQHEIALQQLARLEAEGHDPLVVQRNGVAVESAYVTIAHKAHLRLLRAAEQLGFSPSSRPRLAPGQPPEKPDDAWSELAAIFGKKEDVWDKLDEPLTPQ
jgi:P27 family predicted phage terminase small subunit